MSDNPETEDYCAECERLCERSTKFLIDLEDIVYEAIRKNFGPVEELSDEEFETIGTAVLGLVSVTLHDDLELFDLEDLKIPSQENQN